jgi:hypothetical protein
VNLSIPKVYLNMFHQVPSPKSLSLTHKRSRGHCRFSRRGEKGGEKRKELEPENYGE